MTDDQKLLTRVEGRVGYLVFNNPDRHNAVSLAMWERAAEVLGQFARNTEVFVVVLTGAGNKAFVSGADISKFEHERGTKEAVDRYNAAVDRAFTAVHAMPKPTIAMIRGYCVGGGLGFASNCDIRIANEEARFAMPAAKLGLGYDINGIRRFVEVLGPSFTKEMFFTARQFDAKEASAMGFVNRVVPDAEIETYVRDYAELIAANAPLTIASAKFIVGELLKDESKRDLKRCTELVQRCFASNDYQEGRRAFMEKRKPTFTGS
jgi:enoyl-CoA hydratase/carnithine racemase